MTHFRRLACNDTCSAPPRNCPWRSQEEELYDAIFQEIQERWDHLEEMKRSGVGAQHEGRIRAEVRRSAWRRPPRRAQSVRFALRSLLSPAPAQSGPHFHERRLRRG